MSTGKPGARTSRVKLPDQRVPQAHLAAVPPAHPPARCSLLPRLLAVGASPADVARFAGGWLFDHVAAGWDVTVLTVDHGDPRPLRILGAPAHHLDRLLAVPVVVGPGPEAIAFRADLYDCDARVRGVVLAALSKGAADIRLWGDRWPADLPASPGLVWHRLSMAAQAFKAQALAAAAGPADASGGIEMFRRGVIRHRPALVPVR
jgi:hypothetical protein